MEAGQPRWDLHHVRSLLCVAKIRKKIPDGDLQESKFRASVAERVGQFKMTRILMEQKKQRELEWYHKIFKIPINS